MKIMAISDTHFTKERDRGGRSLWNLEEPEADVLVHAGDATFRGAPEEWAEFEKWWAYMPYQNKIFVPGNHDFRPPFALWNEVDLANGFKVIEVEGVKFGLCPFTTKLMGWAFQATELKIREVLEAMGQIDVLVTHAPPMGILDQGIHIGSHAIFDLVHSEKKPKVHVFGHVHEGHGFLKKNGVEFYNVAVCDRQYALTNKVTVIEI